MPVWLRIFTFNKIKEFYDQTSPKKKNEESWLKNDVAKKAAIEHSKVNPPEFVKDLKGKISYK